jgi:cellulose biosynthesis protein BcsQ
MLENCNRLIKPMPSIRVVLNNFDKHKRFDRDFKLELQRIFGDELLQTQIRASVRIIEAAAQGATVVELHHDYPVTEDFKWLSREILGLPVERESSGEPVSVNSLSEEEVVFETMAAGSAL